MISIPKTKSVPYNRTRHTVTKTLFCCPEFAQTPFREMDLDDWRIHAARAWEIAGILTKEFVRHKQEELDEKANGLSASSLDVFEAIYNGSTRCSEIAQEIRVSKGQVSKTASHLISRGG
jgi:hypothetical protein